VIRRNYDALIDYNLLTSGMDTLEFPDLPMSEQARIHFTEVKRIFVALQVMCVVSGLILIIGLYRKIRRRDYGCLKLTGIVTLVVPVVLGILAAVNWDAFFIRFHRIFFSNNYWIFNPVTDPIIDLLPDSYFLHCTMAILGLLLTGAVLNLLAYRLLSGRSRKRRGRRR
jgi:integral membrane protein (TIGR01906 family)